MNDLCNNIIAVKCNPDPKVLCLLAALGLGFDCASAAEIQLVLNLKVDPSRIIFANPCKIQSAIRYANDQGVSQTTFDSAEQLRTIKDLNPQADLFLRIRISEDDISAPSRFGAKFGTPLEEAPALLDMAKELELKVVGISFHVGSGGSDQNVFVKAISDARAIFDQALFKGFDLHTIDVGGGFDGGDGFKTKAASLRRALDKHFPSNIRIIAEPGRYFVESAFTLVTNVINRREHMLYLNDGVYSNLRNAIVEQPLTPRTLRQKRSHVAQDEASAATVSTTEYCIWGRTCCPHDCINSSCRILGIINPGDWVYFENIGGENRFFLLCRLFH